MADTIRTTTGSTPGGASFPASPGQREDGQRAGRAIADVREMGTELAAAMRDSATTLFVEQRNRAADEIAALGEALRRSAQSLDQNGGTVAHYADEAARQIGQFADTLRHRSWNQLTEDVEGFGRRWPAVFIGAAVAVGFMAGRFMSASASRPKEAPPSSSFGAPGMGGSPAMRREAGTVSGAASAAGRSGYGAAASRENG